MNERGDSGVGFASDQGATALVFGVSDFVAVLNQTLEFAYPSVTIVGELANFRISKNKWVYFDLKDEHSSVKFFGTIYNLPGPLEDGLNLQVRAVPRLHPQYGFSLTVQSIQPVGEGSIKKAAALLESKLESEGLFDVSRKRALPYPPKTIGLITSSESAAYADFAKILNQRWGGLDIQLADVQVQGEAAPGQIVDAIEYFNKVSTLPEILVITRGGGSAEDLQAFNNELLVRAVAGSRIPTLVAIGHEIDVSLAERAADQRASTPSNAAELLVPDKTHELIRLNNAKQQFGNLLTNIAQSMRANIIKNSQQLNHFVANIFSEEHRRLLSKKELLEVLSPQAAMRRGYAVLYAGAKLIRSFKDIKINQNITAQILDATLTANVKEIRLK